MKKRISDGRLGRWTVFGAITSAIVIGGCAGPERSAGASKNLDGLIEAFVQLPPRNKDAVERMLGVKLKLTRSTGWVDTYTGNDIDLTDTTIEQVEYRAPKLSTDHGGLLVLTLGGQCVSVAEFMRRHRSWALVAGRGSKDGGIPLIEWDRHLPWGTLAFEFNVSTDCLNFVSMDVR